MGSNTSHCSLLFYLYLLFIKDKIENLKEEKGITDINVCWKRASAYQILSEDSAINVMICTFCFPQCRFQTKIAQKIASLHITGMSSGAKLCSLDLLLALYS